MRTFPRLVVLVLAIALFGCTYLPWVGDLTAQEVAFRTLLSPSGVGPDGWLTSMAVPVTVAAALLLFGAIANGRVLVVIGGLAAIGFPAAWLLSNMVGEGERVELTAIGAGLYGSIVIGLIALVLSAVAIDARAPSVR